MDVKLPLYLGATLENMRKGAAIMGETSLPLGTKNSNCVIAAHRGYEGIPYFREIERLKIGDRVIIKNPWEKLTYRVDEIKIIQPDDSDQIKIRKGKDMVTLLTCHPYRSHGNTGMLCTVSETTDKRSWRKRTNTIKDTHFQSSEWDIQREKLCHMIGLGILLIFWIIIIKNWKGTIRKGGKA